MRSRRKIPIAAITACALLGPVASSAAASPLLSGYGGPGQGDQAILGAALLNGRGKGGGSSPGAPTSLAAPSTAVSKLTKTSGSKRSSAHRRGGAAGNGSGDASKTAARAYTAPTVAGAAPPATGSSGGVLGLSIADLVYILLALGGLAAVAALTRALVSAPRQDGQALKG